MKVYFIFDIKKEFFVDTREIKKVLKQINNNIHSINNAGYLYGTTIEKNNLSEKINKRSNPIMKANKLI